MLRITGPGEAAHGTEPDLSRILHPSFGLPSRLALALAAEPTPQADGGDRDDGYLAEVVRIDAVPAFLAHRTPRPRRRR